MAGSQHQDISVLALHSTKDSLGKKNANDLISFLGSNVEIAGNKSVESYRHLAEVLKDIKYFNVLVLIAHGGNMVKVKGKKSEKTDVVDFYNDKNIDGYHILTNIGELQAVLQDYVGGKLCLFGVCKIGSSDLAKMICKNLGARACIAPKRGEKINGKEIINEYSKIINNLHKMPFDTEFFKKGIIPNVDKNLIKRLSIEIR